MSYAQSQPNPHDDPGQTVDLATLAGDLVAEAHTASSRRAARTLVAVGKLRTTLIALAAGTELAEHENPGAATVQVLVGSAVLTADGQDIHVGAGSLAQIPDARHGLRADQDTVVLLTVALT